MCQAFSPNGQTLATASNDHTIRIWDTGTGRQRFCLTGHTSPVHALAFSHDGRVLASAGSDDTIRLWDPATGKEQHSFKEERTPRSSYINHGVHALHFLPDGQTMFSWGEDRMLRTWDLIAKRERSSHRVRLSGLSETLSDRPDQPIETILADKIHWADFTPDGTTVVVAYDKTIYLVNVVRGQEVVHFSRPHGWTGLALSADGQTLAGSCLDKSVRLFELATGQEVLKVALPHGPWCRAAAFSPDGRSIALTAGQGAILIVDVATGKVRTQLQGHKAAVNVLAFGPDGAMLASGLSDTTTLLWEMTPPLQPRKKELDAEMLDQLWVALAGSDAAKAHAAMWTLTAHAEAAIVLLQRNLRATSPVDPQRLRMLIADLDHAQFAQRQKASEELKKLGAAAEESLRDTLKRSPSLEARRSMEAILATPPPWPPQEADALRRMRAIQVLERIGSAAAGQILEKLARGAPTARETQLAASARNRLTGRKPQNGH
jgi:WD40 repeat protein